jgi:hypothetical protein
MEGILHDMNMDIYYTSKINLGVTLKKSGIGARA